MRFPVICKRLHSATLKPLPFFVAPVPRVSCSEFISEFMISNIQKPTVLWFLRFLWSRRWTAVNTEELNIVSSPVSLRWTSAAVSSCSKFSDGFTRFGFNLVSLSRLSRLSHISFTLSQAVKIPTWWPAAWHHPACLEEDCEATKGLTVQVRSHTTLTSYLRGIAFTREKNLFLNGYHKKEGSVLVTSQ